MLSLTAKGMHRAEMANATEIIGGPQQTLFPAADNPSRKALRVLARNSTLGHRETGKTCGPMAATPRVPDANLAGMVGADTCLHRTAGIQHPGNSSIPGGQ